jgi:hypothetical protein
MLLRIAILSIIALLMTGCAGIGGIAAGIPPSPAAAADQTTLDERGAIAVEIAYQAAARAVEALTDAGLIEGAAATRVAEVDRKAFAAVQAARTAYDAGNSASYAEALAKARSEIAALLRLIT